MGNEVKSRLFSGNVAKTTQSENASQKPTQKTAGKVNPNLVGNNLAERQAQTAIRQSPQAPRPASDVFQRQEAAPTTVDNFRSTDDRFKSRLLKSNRFELLEDGLLAKGKAAIVSDEQRCALLDEIINTKAFANPTAMAIERKKMAAAKAAVAPAPSNATKASTPAVARGTAPTKAATSKIATKPAHANITPPSKAVKKPLGGLQGLFAKSSGTVKPEKSNS